MRIASVGTAYPPYRYSQAEITAAAMNRRDLDPRAAFLISKIHSNCGVEYRHFMFPIDEMNGFTGFEKSNDAYIEGSIVLGQQAIQKALDRAGLKVSDISAIF